MSSRYLTCSFALSVTGGSHPMSPGCSYLSKVTRKRTVKKSPAHAAPTFLLTQLFVG